MSHLPPKVLASAPFALIETVRRGLPTKELDRVADSLSLDEAALLPILGISQRTAQRKRSVSDRLSPAASDRLSRLERIHAMAAEILGDPTKAVVWLKRPSGALGNQAPLALLDTDAGSQLVERELRQIEHGFVF